VQLRVLPKPLPEQAQDVESNGVRTITSRGLGVIHLKTITGLGRELGAHMPAYLLAPFTWW
jgi:hypothetical protein